jgi:hypothetical protein
MAGSCRSFLALLHRRTLAVADRYALAEHLDGCRKCAEKIEIIAASRVAVLEPPPRALSEDALARAIEGAFAATGDGRRAAAGDRRRPWMLAAAAVAATAAAAVVLLASRGDPIQLGPVGSTAAADRVIAGEIGAAGVVRTEGDSVPAGVAVDGEAVLVLGSARVTLSPGATIAWDRDARTLRLDRGRVDVSLAPAPGRRFRVSAGAAFLVEVVGTRFRVSPDRVEVTRGVVRILEPATLAVLAELGAGESWRLEPSPEPVAPAVGQAPLSAPPPPAAGERLGAARAALSSGDVSRARQDAAAVLEAGPSREQAAEARTVLAECAQAAGDFALAARLYLAVARRYADLRAGETIFRRYLRRYPTGRFVDDARAHLRALAPPPERGDR